VLEYDAAEAVVAASQQTHVKLLPNHHMNEDLELAGFHFTCNASDLASVMPVPKTLFACTAMYEVRSSEGCAFNTCVLRVLAEQAKARAALEGVVARLRAHECREAPGFDCIADEADDEPVEGVLAFLTHCRSDRRTWAEQLPATVGLYHAFVRKSTKDRIEHKLFIVVSGSLAYADEELFRAWQDSCASTTCAQFALAEETEWLRAATIRNLNRVAAMVAEALELPVTCVIDTEDPSRTKRAAHPTTVTFEHDIWLDTERNAVHMVNSGCFVERSENGVLFRMNAGEGFWLYPGPSDNASGQPYGSVFNSSERCSTFPTTTVKYHGKFGARGAVVSCRRSDNTTLLYEEEDTGVHTSLFPEEHFFRKCAELGFNRNFGIVHLMPLIAYASPNSI
jgi:hypothetical protein